MSDATTTKLLVRRPSRVSTDSRGRTVWADPVESAELELVSTQMLKHMLSSRDDEDRRAIQAAASTASEGVLARDVSNGEFEIIEEDELQAILDQNQGLPKLSRPADVTLEPLRDYAEEEQLSLVSTQALRRVLDTDDDEELPAALNDPGGFDPYNRS